MNTQNARAAQRAQLLRLLDLPHAWAGQGSYTLLDMDDSDGLRFVTLWRQWRSDPNRCARLHVVLVVQALSLASTLRGRLLSELPEQDHVLVEQLVKQWPLNLPGVHRLEFEALGVTLTLAVGSAHVMLSRLTLAADAVLLSEAQLVEPAPSQVAGAVGLGNLVKTNAVLLAVAARAAWPAWFETSLALHEQAVYRLEAGLQPAGPTSSDPLLLRARVAPRALACAGSYVSGDSPAALRHLVVVGGGPSGATAAHDLAMAGHLQIGDGAFLGEVAERLASGTTDPLAALQQSLFGIDCDAEAVAAFFAAEDWSVDVDAASGVTSFAEPGLRRHAPSKRTYSAWARGPSRSATARILLSMSSPQKLVAATMPARCSRPSRRRI